VGPRAGLGAVKKRNISCGCCESNPGRPACSLSLYRLSYPSSQVSFSLIHGAEPFLRSCQLCSYSRPSQNFMEPEGSIPCSQEPCIGPYSEPDQSSPYYPHPISLRCILIFSNQPTSWSSQWSLSFWLSHQYSICIHLLPTHATCPVHLILLDGSQAYNIIFCYVLKQWMTSPPDNF
jgi:hypothetical protein